MTHKWQAKYEALSDEDRRAADDAIEAMVAAFASEDGAMVLLTDPHTGEGTRSANFFYGGNFLLVQPLLSAGAQIVDSMFGQADRVLQ